jgi:hypothetical protein
MSAYKTVITVGDVIDKLDLGFTHIEVWASEDEGGTYKEITESVAGVAKFYSAPYLLTQTLPVGGMTVGFSFSGQTDLWVTFSDLIRDWTLALVVDRLNQVFPGRFAVEQVGQHFYIVGSSSNTGRVASVACTYSEIPGVFPPDVSVRGTDARIQLASGTLIYPYTDIAGKAGTRYKWRFSANGVNPISSFSARVLGDLERAAKVPVSIGTASFVGLDGAPTKRRLLIYEDMLPSRLGAYVVGTGEPKVAESDDTGFLQVTLPQGARVRIAVEGSALVREITVPATQSFDIMTAMASAEDQFTVQTTPPLLTRRSF